MNIFQKITNYIKDSIAELKKVTWPTKRQTINYTLLIIGISLVVAAFIGLIDYLLSLGVQQIIK
ncbi:MAG: preprotein translocase subunit SecE [Candidatus Buchananbacteria bacterium RBG_13_36_9]|uniref:Protein translocase subunit SecE n=1 Tax=Candidatus Buchananbacteria bacterium RBG_13_36_9 TaxID=1797530 RepID=A0A1G1XPZ6_9BACT|nr:MAG: preprotein translocase subunit SecE [Candidatus Buchananbacteria bacterium RBG_13_36_9]